jgi:predicted nucleotidyltransferase
LALGTECGYAVPVHSPVLNRADAVARLFAHEDEIRALGVIRLALFGSVLRGQTHADSDVDLLVQFASGAKTYDRFFALSELLEGCLGRRVELVTTEALSPFIGPRILAEAEDVLRVA